MAYTYKSVLLGSVAAFALQSSITSVLAQDVAQGSLGTIIITSEKREETIQNTAIAVTAVSGTELQATGLQDSNDVLRSFASVEVRQEPGIGRPNVVIRGIRSAFNTDPSVGLYVDGVYQNGSTFPIYDLARVEVLKGPQGTLYGRGALGGAANFITNDPGDEFSGTAAFTYGTYNQVRLDTAINIPITDELASRTAFYFSRHDGYLTNGNNDEKIGAVREKIRFRPNDDFSIILTGEFIHVGGHGAGSVPSPLGGKINFASDNGVVPGPAMVFINGVKVPRPSNPWFSETLAGAISIDKQAFNGRLDWNLGWASVFLQSAYEHYYSINAGNAQRATPGNSFGAAMPAYSTNLTEEFRLSSPESSKVIWVAGAYYSHFANDTALLPHYLVTNTTATYGSPTRGHGPNIVTSLAFFGQATYPVTEEFRITGGLRWTTETQDRTLNLYFPYGGSYPNWTVSGIKDSRHDKATDSAITWKAGVEYDVTPDSLLYADVARGFKAGGLTNNVDTFLAGLVPLSYKPEFLTAYEVGSKNEFLDGTLRLNLDAYYYINTDKQIEYVAGCLNAFPTPPALPVPGVNYALWGNACPIPQTGVVNAAKATAYGFELQGAWLFTPNDLFELNVAWNHTRFDKALLPIPPVAGSYVAGTTFVDPITGETWPIVLCNPPATPTCFDWSGKALPNAPEWTETVSYQHTFDFADGSALSARGSATFVSGHNTDTNIANAIGLDQHQPAYKTFAANLQYTSADGNWVVTLYGDNLSNTVIRQRAFPGTLSIPAGSVWIGKPRTVGVTVSTKF